MFEKINILGVNFHKVTFSEVASFLMNLNEYGIKIFTPNPEMILCALENKDFMDVLNRAHINIPDGIGVLLAAKYLKKGEFKERVTGTDLIQELCKMAAQNGSRVFLLGAQEGVAEKTKEILKGRYPGLNICGVYAGNPNDTDFLEIKKRILETRPDILFTAYGAPMQEIWIDKHLFEFPFVRFAMGVGGAFDFISGKRKRAPLFMRKIGLEWAWRLVLQPSRIKRIFNAVIKFPLKVILSK